jgi:hypothetical protein
VLRDTLQRRHVPFQSPLSRSINSYARAPRRFLGSHPQTLQLTIVILLGSPEDLRYAVDPWVVDGIRTDPVCHQQISNSALPSQWKLVPRISSSARAHTHTHEHPASCHGCHKWHNGDRTRNSTGFLLKLGQTEEVTRRFKRPTAWTHPPEPICKLAELDALDIGLSAVVSAMPAPSLLSGFN